MRRLVAALALAGAPLLAQNSGPPRDVEDVKATLVAMWDAIEQGDSARYASLVHKDFTQFSENDAYLAEGKDLEVRGMGAYMKRARQLHTDMHQPQVTVRGDGAWVVYYWTDGGLVDGRPFSSRGKSTRIFVRENGKWLCIHGHYTAIP